MAYLKTYCGITSYKLGGSPGLLVIGETRDSKVMGSNPSTIYWMDIFSHTFVVKIVMFV